MKSDKSIYIQRGLVYQDMGNHEHAIQDFRKAIDLDERYALSYLHMGVSKLKSHLVREAILDFKKSQELEDNPSVDDGLGSCYHALKNYSEAIDYFDKAISAKPNNVEFLKNRAQCFFDMNMYQLAIDDLNTALM